MNIVTVQQAAKLLQVSDDVLYQMLARNEIPAGKIKGQWRLIQEDLIEWLRSQYHQNAGAPSMKDHPKCRTVEKIAATGGLVSQEYESLLELRTSTKQKP